MLALKQTERVLNAMGEASRLRLLALCALGERAVGDLAGALGQSEPRVSRHLKILAEAGLVERRRDGHRVCYRAATAGDAGEILRTILARLDAGDGTLRRDAGRVQRQTTDGAAVPLPLESRLGRAMREFVTAPRSGFDIRLDSGSGSGSGLGNDAVGGRALILGLRHLELIDAASRLARHTSVVVDSAAAGEIARAWIDRQAVPRRCEVATVAPLPVATWPAAWQAPWQAIILDRVLQPFPALEPTLLAAREQLAPAGGLWLFERYEALEESDAGVARDPLARLRRLLATSGLRCERIQPLETDGVHLLATSCSRATP
jgi:DNA-binding transcriptional ArsR family regulator